MAAVIPLRACKRKEATPYEPTAREAEVLASFERRKAKNIPAPGMKVAMAEVDGTTHAKIEIDHADFDVGSNLFRKQSEARTGISSSVLSTALLWSPGVAGPLIKAK